jgi:hypothetical protein
MSGVVGHQVDGVRAPTDGFDGLAGGRAVQPAQPRDNSFEEDPAPGVPQL